MMKKPLLSTGLSWVWLSALVLAADLGSKYWVMSSFKYFESVKLLPFFSFTYVHNIGAAFSFFEGHRWFLALTAVVICSILLVLLYRNSRKELLTNMAYSLIIGGALGNLFDRLIHGYVIDFLHFYITYWKIPIVNIVIENWHYPVFNLADVSICIGAAFIIIDALRPSKMTKPCKVHHSSLDD